MSTNHDHSPYVPERTHLQADCQHCFGLCCVALPYSASSDFAFDKEAGDPCPNLQSDFRCCNHTELRQRGMRGCTVYDCFGAGQKVSQVTFQGSDWRQAPETAKRMYDVFPMMWQLHELLWYLTEALSWNATLEIHDDLRLAVQETNRLTFLSPEDLLQVNVASHRAEINVLLLRTSKLVREETSRMHKGPRKTRNIPDRGADLIGAKLKGADLRYQSLRGAYLIAADLRGADLRVSDLIGADFRDADIRGADLTESLFLTQAQLNAAKGDACTKLPPMLTRPFHWDS
ncbi:pentapeptide repeat-containing protein [Paenibacillus sp. HJL G12]|uniref:Pentapeptide repeat-containing protein n=1 Tax=Paenibacillus dendrobii TaxID=2691084 RepID=A0A7X3IG94_9BACL|nr:pentapeptide repeat-containing protein [Paenibacillus dendrobii]MWV42881.1 pentapeptide repeat-containing protein [Paenibacillus dendrobii]